MTRIAQETVPDPLWPSAGTLLQTRGTATEHNRIVSDGAGGAYVGWNDRRNGGPLFNPTYYDLYVQHVLASGQVDPTWPENGLPICLAPDAQYNFDMEPDGAGGFYILWEDNRNDFWQIFALRVRPDGSRWPGWQENGNLMCDRLMSQISPDGVSDGMHGLYLIWASFPTGSDELHGQHVRGDGSIAPGWSPAGRPIAAGPVGSFANQTVVSDGFGGMLLAYNHNGPTFTRVQAQRIEADPVVATVPSVVDVNSANGLVTLRWESSDAQSGGFSVQRRQADENWIDLGPPRVVSSSLLMFEDRALPPGRYAYRLRSWSGGAEAFTVEAWVSVESSARIALAGFRPNPAVGSVALGFELTDAGPASLEVHDVRGRRVWARDVGSLGAGKHLVRLDEESKVSPGVYWIRLRHSGGELLAKGVVAR